MNETDLACRWSDKLADALLRGMSHEEFNSLGETADLDVGTVTNFSEADQRHLLVEQSRCDGSLQLAIMRCWRRLNAALVAAAEHMPIDGCSAEQCEAMIQHFGTENVLLELITEDPHDDGMVTKWVVDNIASESLRRELTSILEDWFAAGPDAAEPAIQTGPTARIVIFGGHHRDENKMNERLFDNSRFEVRWKPCEKSRGTPDDKTLHEAMAAADAAIVVTSMVSHNVMIIVRRFAKKYGIAFRTVTKATDVQLKAVLEELFSAEKVP